MDTQTGQRTGKVAEMPEKQGKDRICGLFGVVPVVGLEPYTASLQSLVYQGFADSIAFSIAKNLCIFSAEVRFELFASLV